MYQDAIWFFLFQYPANTGENCLSYVRQILIRAHDVKVMVGADVKNCEDAVKHLPVLGGYANPTLNLVRGRKGMDYWRHLDGFRPCSKNV